LKSLGLASLQRTIARQEARLLWLKEGDDPTQFFHCHANSRHRRNHIAFLDQDGVTVASKEGKAQTAFDFFNHILGTPPPTRSNGITLEQLKLLQLELASLCGRFSKDEVWLVIRSLPLDKSPGPDGFTVCFLQTTWPIIRGDIMRVFDAFWHQDIRNLHGLNGALISLIPKLDAASSIKDY
jgi:hypothetical protein